MKKITIFIRIAVLVLGCLTVPLHMKSMETKADLLAYACLSANLDKEYIESLLHKGFSPLNCIENLNPLETIICRKINNESGIVDEVLELFLRYCKKHELRFSTAESFSLLRIAIEQKSPKLLLLAIESGADVNVANSSNETPLLIACSEDIKNYEIIKILLDHGANPNAINIYTSTPLTLVCCSDSLEEHNNIVTLLLDHGADPSIPANRDRNSIELVLNLKKARYSFNVQNNFKYNESICNKLLSILVQHFIKKNLALPNNLIYATLTESIKNKEYDFIALMLDSGIDCNLCDSKGTTLLRTTCSSKKPSTRIINKLISLGAQLTKSTNADETPLTTAILENNSTLVELIAVAEPSLINRQNTKKITPFFSVLKHNNKKILDILIKHGADTHFLDTSGNNLLHWAVILKKIEIAELLLIANPEMRSVSNNDKKTPLDHAKKNKDIEDLFATPLIILAAKNNKLALLHKYIEKSSSIINVTDLDGMTPLMHAVNLRHEEMVNLLLLHKADTSHRDNLGNSALFYAAQQDNILIFDMLLKANPTMLHKPNIYGKTAYLLASRNKNYKFACTQLDPEKHKLSEPKKQFSKEAKKKDHKKQEAKAANTLIIAEKKATQKSPSMIIIPRPKEIQEEILLYECHTRCLRWRHHSFLAYKKQQYQENDEVSGEIEFRKACRYHQIPFIIVNRLIEHGKQNKQTNTTYQTTDTQYSLYGQMQFKKPHENPWSPGKQYQAGTYHCTAGKDGIIYHLGFKPNISGDTEDTLAPFSEKNEQTDSYLAFYTGTDGVRHLICYPKN